MSKYFFLYFINLFCLHSVIAQDNTLNKDFFNSESQTIILASSNSSTKEFPGPISLFRKSFSQNILVNQGPVELYQTSIAGDLHLQSGDLLGEQSSIMNLTLDKGNAELHNVTIMNNVQINNGNVKIEGSNIKNIRVNGLFKALHSQIKTIHLSREAYFDTSTVASIVISSEAQENLVHVINSRIQKINFQAGGGVVYLDITPDIKPPEVTGGRIIRKK